MLTKALLTAGNPQGDVLFGVDNNLLSRALGGDLFEAYESPGLERVDEQYVLDPEHRATPIDHGEVCLNYDKAWFAERGIAPPRVARRPDPRRGTRALVVAENPATSTPGLAFLLATVARFGDGGWQEYWRDLRENDVLVVDGWEEAYTVRFSGVGGQGQPADRRLVRVEPAGRGDLPDAASGGGADRGRRGQLLPAGRVRRRPARRAQRGGRARADRLHALDGASRRTSRSRCSSSR